MTDDVANSAIDPAALPTGFRAPKSTIVGNMPCPNSYVYNNTGSVKQYLG